MDRYRKLLLASIMLVAALSISINEWCILNSCVNRLLDNIEYALSSIFMGLCVVTLALNLRHRSNTKRD
jgi:hypothetical protein